MKTLCIYGCGGMGREIADLSQRIGKWQEIIFVDDNIKSREVDAIRVYTLEEVNKQFDNNDLEFIISVGEPTIRKALYDKLAGLKLKFAKIIDPAFILSRSSSVAKGTIVHTGVVATCNVHIGEGCLINNRAVIGHDVTIGEYSVISPNVTISGGVNIGPCCYLGSGAIIRNGIDIGAHSIIGMGAVVLKDVQPNSVMVGNPARFLRENLDKKVFR
jgi:sugar O-acyltransferase (sialic acid O-acetyltransferase NeuD family)